MHGARVSRIGVVAMAFGTLGMAFGPTPLAGQESATDTTTTRWTVRDLLMEESAGGFEFSPDGEWLVWSRSKMDAERGRSVSKLWLTRVSDRESWQLTRGDDSDRSPAWSPDGERIAFVSSRDLPGGDGDGDDEGGGSQIWMLRLQGGEPWPVTRDVRGLRGFEWKGRSDTLVVLATEARARFERERRRADDDAIAVEDTLDAVPVRLWSVAVEDGDVERITENDDRIESMAVSPDGTTAVIRTEVSLAYDFDERTPPRTWLVDLATGERTEILAAEREQRIIPSGVEWAPDGRGFYFAYRYSTHPVFRSATVTRLAYYDVADRRFVPVDLDWERGVSGFEVVPGGFVAFLTDGVVDRPARYARHADGWGRRMIEGEHVPNVWSASVSDDGTRIAYRHSTASTPDQPYLARLEGGIRIADPERIVTLNPSYASKPKPRTEIVHWTGARGDEVEGVLYYPLDWEEGRPHPLVLNIHGGPAGRDSDAWDQSWASPIVLWNQKGAFVLQVNYHGSCCYGLEWVESIGGGNYYSLEVPDIESGVDWLIERGMVHPDSVATQGWSNGAILSTALTVENPERYKASLAGAGDVEWISDFGNVDFGAAFDTYYFGTTPWEDPQRYIDLSPFFRLDEVRTPTLIFFGTEDRNVPPSQGWSHFRALQQMGNTEVRFVLFPGEPHGLRELAHQRRKVEEEIRWLERHLWGLPDSARLAESLALAEGSPLAAALARAAAERSEDGMYGVRVGGVLVPETVPVDELQGVEVGRFEVTRAQWREFRPGYEVEGATLHHPVNGIDFEEARAYVAWLSERTGRSYRLPRESELRRLTRGKRGITLEHWAGYDPNLDDRERLRELVDRLPGFGPLLLEVGSHSGDATGAPPHLFDLGGNVAEWAVAEDGSGVLVGGSADRPTDAASGEEARPAYRGLRVVVGG